MSQVLSDVVVHLVFSTKGRRPFLRDHEVRTRLYREMGGTSNRLNCQSLIVGGAEDHVHLLGQLGRTITLADWVKELKRATSVWMKKESPSYKAFAWQAGYGAFSVSHSRVDDVRAYIREQERHHQKTDFQTEFRALLKRHQVEFKEEFVWD